MSFFSTTPLRKHLTKPTFSAIVCAFLVPTRNWEAKLLLMLNFSTLKSQLLRFFHQFVKNPTRKLD